MTITAIRAERLEERLVLSRQTWTDYLVTVLDPSGGTSPALVTFDWDLTDPTGAGVLASRDGVAAAASDLAQEIVRAGEGPLALDGVIVACDASYAANDAFFSWIADLGLAANQGYTDPSVGVHIDPGVHNATDAQDRARALLGQAGVLANACKNMTADINAASGLDAVAKAVYYSPYVQQNSYALKVITAELKLLKAAYPTAFANNGAGGQQ